MPLSQTYSGIVLNQNASPSASVSLLPPATGVGAIYQTFQLPSDYVRGSSTIAPLTGFHLYLPISTGQAPTTSVAWELDVNAVTGWSGGSLVRSWVSLASGTTTGTAHDGNTWFSVYFDTPIDIEQAWLTAQFRISLAAQSLTIWYSSPNPLQYGQAFLANNSPLLDSHSNPTSLMFRVLAGVADSGTDFLGNIYRSCVTRSPIANVAPASGIDVYWLSQPNPSSFAVEPLYLDIRANDAPTVIDRMTIDPITPGVWCHLYYSSDPNGPGTTVQEWDNLLWTPIYKPFQLNRKTTFALPEPLVAKYAKIEFTNLQPRYYNPGQFQVPATFRKYPKWILDYFIANYTRLAPDLLSSGVDVTYDALDLAFTYYEGDINQDPEPPALAQPPVSTPALNQQIDQVDPATLSQIKTAFQPFTTSPASQAEAGTVLGDYVISVQTNNYSTETITPAQGDTSIVSNFEREALLVEKAFPVMFFYIPCRHAYRMSQALFQRNTGYFAGVKHLILHREVYTGPADRTQYNENMADGMNALINDALDPLAD